MCRAARTQARARVNNIALFYFVFCYFLQPCSSLNGAKKCKRKKIQISVSFVVPPALAESPWNIIILRTLKKKNVRGDWQRINIHTRRPRCQSPTDVYCDM